MPVTFHSLSAEEQAELSKRTRSAGAKVDLTPYVDYIEGLNDNTWGCVFLNDETVRRTKMRLTNAAKELEDTRIRFQTKAKAAETPDRLYFRVNPPQRPKKPKTGKVAVAA